MENHLGGPPLPEGKPEHMGFSGDGKRGRLKRMKRSFESGNRPNGARRRGEALDQKKKVAIAFPGG